MDDQHKNAVERFQQLSERRRQLTVEIDRLRETMDQLKKEIEQDAHIPADLLSDFNH